MHRIALERRAVFALRIALAVGPLLAQAGAAVASDSIRVPLPDGAVEIAVPAGWESNPRLALDNAVLAFFHPSGLKPGEEASIWLLVERRERSEGESFPEQVRAIIAEGKEYGFSLEDSAAVPTSEGRIISTYRFRTQPPTLHCELGALKTPAGILLFRTQADSEEVWRSHVGDVRALLQSVRLRPN